MGTAQNDDTNLSKYYTNSHVSLARLLFLVDAC